VDPMYSDEEVKENILVWKEVTIRSSTDDLFDTRIIADDPDKDAIRIVSDHVRIEGFVIMGSTGTGTAGIHMIGNIQDCYITGCKIAQNGVGVMVDTGANATIEWNSFVDNSEFGVRNVNGAVEVKAENNWWSSPSGPGGSVIMCHW